MFFGAIHVVFRAFFVRYSYALHVLFIKRSLYVCTPLMRSISAKDTLRVGSHARNFCVHTLLVRSSYNTVIREAIVRIFH